MAKWTKKHRENHRAAMADMSKRKKASALTTGGKGSEVVVTKTNPAEWTVSAKVRKNIGKKSSKAIKAIELQFLAKNPEKPVAQGNLKCVQILADTTASSLNELTLAELNWLVKNDPDYALKLRELSDVAATLASIIQSRLK